MNYIVRLSQKKKTKKSCLTLWNEQTKNQEIRALRQVYTPRIQPRGDDDNYGKMPAGQWGSENRSICILSSVIDHRFNMFRIPGSAAPQNRKSYCPLLRSFFPPTRMPSETLILSNLQELTLFYERCQSFKLLYPHLSHSIQIPELGGKQYRKGIHWEKWMQPNRFPVTLMQAYNKDFRGLTMISLKIESLAEGVFEEVEHGYRK